MIDEQGTRIVYWYVNLEEGQTSETTTLALENEGGLRLKCSDIEQATVFGRIVGEEDFIDLSGEGIDLTGLEDPEFELYVSANGEIVGLERVALNVLATNSSPAGWTN